MRFEYSHGGQLDRRFFYYQNFLANNTMRIKSIANKL